MVTVHVTTADQATAWRIRDALAGHPLLGGPAAKIEIMAGRESVILVGWAQDEALAHMALRLARRTAGRRVVLAQVLTGCAASGCRVRAERSESQGVESR